MTKTNKILINHKDLKQALSLLSMEGKTIVFTNGCFDIIHAGHVAYLEEAKAMGDVLVVALNSDESVRRLKGSNRPIVHEENRLKVMAALSSVDFVTLFMENTPLQLIEMILPDILVKGGDWKIADIVGSQAVLQNGGQVRSLNYIEGNSTTNIEQKIILNYLSQFSESKSK